MIIITIGIFLFLGYACLIIYYRNSWKKAPVFQRKKPAEKSVLPFISVIIPARNEAENIGKCLKSILNGDYPADRYEVIVADDFSEDGTAAIIEATAPGHVHLLKLSDHVQSRLNSYKKEAIKLAINQSKGELIVTTDADCLVRRGWLKTIASFYIERDASFIAAPVAFMNENNFLDKFQSLDFMTLQGITGASVYRKIYAMCNGANLAYKKSSFYAVDGFNGIDDIASGDDMLLMHKIQKAFPNGVHYLKSRQAIVSTEAMPTISSFINQRIRWASKTGKYQEKKLVGVLMLVYLFNAWFIIMAVASFFSLVTLVWMIVLLFAKTLVELFYLSPVAKFFYKSKMLWWFPIAQPFHILYTVIAGWLGTFGTYKWKGRTVK